MGYVIFQTNDDLVISNKVTDGNISFETIGDGNVLLKDSSTWFVDSDSDGKRAKFDLANLTLPSFRTISIPDNDGTMALTSDLHNRQHSINSANDHTGILPIDMGGTNSNSTPTAGALMYYDGANQKIVGSSATISDSMITANLTGNVTGNVTGSAGYATSAGSANSATTATTATQVGHSLSHGNGLTGSSFNGSSSQEWNLDFGTGSSQVAVGNHTHTGVYEPAFSTLGVSKGGTGVSSFATNSVVVSTDPGTSALSTISSGSAGQFLGSNGAGYPPSFQAITANNISSGNLNIARMPTGGTWALSSALATSGAYDVNFANNISVASGKKISLNGAGGNNYLIRNVRNAQECIDFYVNGVARGFLGFNGATWGFFAL